MGAILHPKLLLPLLVLLLLLAAVALLVVLIKFRSITHHISLVYAAYLFAFVPPVSEYFQFSPIPRLSLNRFQLNSHMFVLYNGRYGISYINQQPTHPNLR